jgi:hypothetical protein
MRRASFLVIVVAYSVLVTADGATAEYRQFSCSLDNNWVAFELREASETGTTGARTYVVDFQERGPTIRLPPSGYAPDWKDVEEITFQHLGNGDYGRLSLRIHDPVRQTYTQPIGVVQRACWEAAKGFLNSRKITVHISEPNVR